MLLRNLHSRGTPHRIVPLDCAENQMSPCVATFARFLNGRHEPFRILSTYAEVQSISIASSIPFSTRPLIFTASGPTNSREGRCESLHPRGSQQPAAGQRPCCCTPWIPSTAPRGLDMHRLLSRGSIRSGGMTTSSALFSTSKCIAMQSDN